MADTMRRSARRRSNLAQLHRLAPRWRSPLVGAPILSPHPCFRAHSPRLPCRRSHVIPGLLGFALWLFLLTWIARIIGAKTFLLGWWFGLGYFVVGLYWIAIAFFTDAEKFGALALPAVLLLCAVMAVFPGNRGTGIYRPAAPAPSSYPRPSCPGRRPGSSANGCAPSFLWGFPWNLIGYVWIATLPISQMAAYVGIYGLEHGRRCSAGALWLTAADR